MQDVARSRKLSLRLVSISLRARPSSPPIDKAKQLGETIVQLQDTNLLLNALVQPMMLPKQVVERKDSIEEITTQFETMEQEAKTIMEETIKFWQSVV